MLRRVLISLAIATAACDEHAHDHDPNEEACEHLAMGPAVAVTAGAAAAGAPAVSDDHRRYDVSLVDIAAGKGGFVTFAASAAGDYVVFTDAAVPVEVTNAAMSRVPPTATAASVAGCAEVQGRQTFPLSVGTYVVGFGPTTVATVGLVIEREAAAH